MIPSAPGMAGCAGSVGELSEVLLVENAVRKRGAHHVGVIDNGPLPLDRGIVGTRRVGRSCRHLAVVLVGGDLEDAAGTA